LQKSVFSQFLRLKVQIKVLAGWASSEPSLLSLLSVLLLSVSWLYVRLDQGLP
jgi:hypothetical protein